MPTKIIGTEAYQVPRNSDLGSLAYQSAEGAHLGTLVVDGNVGIGNSNPSTKLDVSGTIRSYDGIVNNSLYTLNTVGYVGTVSNHPLSLVTNNLTRLTISAAGDTTVSNNLIVTGNLTINGTTTTTNSATVTIDDPIFTLGGDTAPASDDAKDRGIEFRWFNVSAKVGFFGFDRSTGRLTFIPDATNSSEVFSGTLGAIDVSGVFISGTALSAANLSNSTTGTAGTAVVLATSPTITTPTLSSPTLSGTTTLSAGKVRTWTASDTDIDGLISGTISGLLFEGSDSGHFTFGIRGNDIGDGFQIVSKDAATTPATDPYKLLVFEAKANGKVQVGGGAIGTGLFNVNQNTIGNGTVSNTAGGTTVTGVNTTFTTTFKVGDTITIPAITGQTVTISAITSDTLMTTAAITAANTAVSYALVGGQRLTVLGNGNIGIGNNSPVSKLDISGGALGTTLNSQLIISRLTSTAAGNISNIEISTIRDSAGTDWTTTGSRFQQKIDTTWQAWMQFNGTGKQQGISFGTGGSTTNALGVVERLRIDASGNLGLGVTPSAWGSNFKALESAAAAAVVIASANVNGVGIASNTYNDNTNWIYKTTGTAARYSVNTGVHQWFNAASGTAGNPITFTQAMTLDASGNLGISTTDPTGGNAWDSATQILGIAGDATASISSYGAVVLTNNRATPSAGDAFGVLGFTSQNSVAGHKLKAYIAGVAEGAGGVTGGYGGAISFYTRADNTTTLPERMRIDSFGDLIVHQQMSLGGTHSPESGPILTLGTLASGGTGYMNGTHTAVTLTGGTGAGVLATVVVALGVVSSVTLTWGGRNYKVGEVLTVPTLATTLATTVASGNGTTATITFATQAAAPFQVGAQIIVAGVTPTGYNGTYTVTACTTTTVSYLNATTGAQTVAGTVKMGAALTASTIPISTVNQVNLYVSSALPRIRLENTSTAVTTGSELGTLYFSSRDASANASGDTTYIRGVGVNTSGGGELQFFTSPNGGASFLAAVISASNTLRLYNSAGTFYSDISSAATANRTVTLPDGNVALSAGTMAITGGTLGQFAATTSSQLASVISDETGTGALVFATSPSLTTPAIGAATGTSLALTGNMSGATITARPAATQDAIILSGRAGGTSTFGVTITSAALTASRTVTLPDGNVTLTAGTTVVTDATNQTIAGTKTFSSQIVSSVATGTAPLSVASTTLVTNLNADLLDGLNSATANTVSTIVARDASGNFSAGTITAALTGNASTATSVGSLTGIATVAPLAAGTAAVGTSTLGARQDHVHPLQTTISGNAGSANYLVSYANSASGVKTARTVWASGAYTYGGASDPNSPTAYFAATGFGNGAGGSGEIGVNWVSAGGGIWYRALRDTIDNWFAWTRILDASNYNSYSPTLTGTGASGSWSINAATTTMASGRTDTAAYPVVWGTTGTTSQLYSCTAVNIQSSTGTLNATSVAATAAVQGAYLGVNNSTGSNGYGISLYGGAIAGQPTYGIMFQQTATFGTHGSVTADWATYFTMDVTANRGWVFRNITNGNVASVNNAGTAVFNGNVTAYSDIRLKTEIRVIDDAVSKVKKLRGVTYDRIDNKDLGRQTGVIAQEVLKVLPEAVMGDESTVYSVAYGNMVGLLIEAIKEQQQQYDAQQERIAQLEAAVAKLLGSK